MAVAFDAWTVLPHEPIEKIGENLWTVEGKMPDGKTQRRMVVARLADGRLVVHNAIALDDAEMKELDAFGKVAAIVVPNAFHRQDSRIFKKRYPDAKVYCPRGSTKKVLAAVPVDGDYTQVPSDATVRAFHLEGVKDREGVLEIESADGRTLVFNDAVLNMTKLRGLFGFLLSPTGRPSVPRVMRYFIVSDRRALADHLLRLAQSTNLKRIMVAHGRTIVENPGGVLSSVARELAGV